jgi:hypothetical protein
MSGSMTLLVLVLDIASLASTAIAIAGQAQELGANTRDYGEGDDGVLDEYSYG